MVADKYIEWARDAVDQWDGCDTADLFLLILEKTGENVRDQLEAARYKWNKGITPAPLVLPPCAVRLWNAGKPSPRTCERCGLGPCVYGEQRKEPTP